MVTRSINLSKEGYFRKKEQDADPVIVIVLVTTKIIIVKL